MKGLSTNCLRLRRSGPAAASRPLSVQEPASRGPDGPDSEDIVGLCAVRSLLPAGHQPARQRPAVEVQIPVGQHRHPGTRASLAIRVLI